MGLRPIRGNESRHKRDETEDLGDGFFCFFSGLLFARGFLCQNFPLRGRWFAFGEPDAPFEAAVGRHNAGQVAD